MKIIFFCNFLAQTASKNLESIKSYAIFKIFAKIDLRDFDSSELRNKNLPVGPV